MLAVLCGADDFEEIALFGQQKAALLRPYLALPYGPPSADTISRIFQRLDVARFNACFLAWVQEVLPPIPVPSSAWMARRCAVPVRSPYT